MHYRSKNLLLFFLIALAVLTINLENILAALNHHYFLNDQDGYMHMVVASDFLKKQDWYQHFNARINAPLGSDTHGWTQVISLLLISGTLVLDLIMPLSKALYIWGFVLPMLCNAIAAYAMLWAIKSLNPTNFQKLFIIAAFLLNPFLSSLFVPLNVDYDFLLITLSIIYWGCLLRLIVNNKNIWAISVAILAGIGLWTSISFIIIVFIGLIFIAGLSVVQNRMSIATLNVLLVVLCMMLALAIRLEHRYFFTVAYDIVSIVHLTFFLLILIGTNIYAVCNRESKKSVKIIFILTLLVIIFFLMNYLFPGFYYGPYNQVSPYLLQFFFPVISEFYSPFTIDSAVALAVLCYFIIGVGFFYYRYLDNQPLELPQILLLWAAIATISFTIFMYRWNEFSSPLTILLVSFFVASCCNKKMSNYLRLAIVGAMVFMPSAILSLGNDFVPLAHLQCQQQFHKMIEDNFLELPQFTHDKTLFVHSNYGPLILFYTHYSIVATNDHHNPEGVKDSFTFFKSDESAAKKIIAKRQIDLILLCQAEHPVQFDPNQSQWLQPIVLPEKYPLWRLYRVVHHAKNFN